jgi:uncharacterized protein
MTTQESKALAMSWLEAGFGGDFDRWLGMLHDDLRYWFCGRWVDKAGFLKVVEGMQQFMKGNYTYEIGAITAEDDRVVIEAETNYDLQNGGHYHNIYVSIMKFRDGKLHRYFSHNDTLAACRTFEPIGVWKDVDPQARESPVEHVLMTITGPVPRSQPAVSA